MPFVILPKLAPLGTAIVGAISAAHLHVKEAFPPTEGKTYKIGTTIIHEGEPHKVLGWTGHHKAAFTEEMTKRPLYYGDKATAQNYAKLNGREEGAVGLIIAKEHPGHAPQRFEGPHSPLCPHGMEKTETKIIHVEPLKPENDVRFLAAYRRAIDHYLSSRK